MKKILDYLLLISALLISIVSAFYSISGLTSIFSGAFIPVIVLGSVLELSKVVSTLFLHENWDKVKLLLKIYLTSAIIVLSLISSMGIFGFLSKAHIGQSLTADTINSKISIYETQITSIQADEDADKDTLKQLDKAISLVISSSTNETGATKALNIRNGQQAERAKLTNDISEKQKSINDLRHQESPLQLELQKNNIEVGPIRYIAEMIYGANPSQSLIDSAVRIVIILLVMVFDPLALAMLLAFDLHTKEEDGLEVPKNRKKKVPAKAIIQQLEEDLDKADELTEDEKLAVTRALKRNSKTR